MGSACLNATLEMDIIVPNRSKYPLDEPFFFLMSLQKWRSKSPHFAQFLFKFFGLRILPSQTNQGARFSRPKASTQQINPQKLVNPQKCFSPQKCLKPQKIFNP